MTMTEKNFPLTRAMPFADSWLCNSQWIGGGGGLRQIIESQRACRGCSKVALAARVYGEEVARVPVQKPSSEALQRKISPAILIHFKIITACEIILP
jgi:hypothetical protein